MRLEALKLRNFQGHDDFLITFAPDVTTIIGPTDAGKSSILRALRWVCLNEGSLDDLIQHEATNVRVALKIEHEDRYYKVTRERGTTVGNIYTLQDRTFKAFGVDVPPPIVSTLAVNEINFQAQMDAHFWFSLSPPEVSRQLNAIVDLSVIDDAMANMASEVRTATERKSICGERVSEIKRALEEVEGQRDRVQDFKTLEELYAEANNVDSDCRSLGTILSDIRANDYKDKDAKAADAKALLTLARTSLDLERDEITLFELLHQAQANQTIQGPPEFKPVTDALQQFKNLKRDAMLLRDLLGLSESAIKRITSLDNAAQRAEAEFHKQIEGKSCPICQKPLRP